MKIAFVILNFLVFTAQAQTWYWTKQADSSTSQTATQVAVDRNNNIYYTGYSMGTRMSFGAFGINLTGYQSDFVVKYTTNGTPLWARASEALNASASTSGVSVATDRNNNVIESGYFSDSIAFGAYHLSSKNASDNTFLAKYDPNGNILWAVSATIPATGFLNENYGVATDKWNNIYITGYFDDTVFFGTHTLSANGVAMYLVKYNSSGNVIWARTNYLPSSSGSVYGLSVAADTSGNAYVSGNLSDSAYFGSFKLGNTGGPSIFLAKYDSAGNALWAINTNALPGQILPTPVVVDKSNNVYLGFQFTNATLSFGTYTVTDGAAPSCSNAGLVKYTPNGNVLWATCADFISTDEVCVIIESAVTVDRCKNVYWSGLCSDTFGVGNVKVTVKGGGSNPTMQFAYVIKLDSNANPIAGAALRNQNPNSFSNYLVCDSLSKVLFVSELVNPAAMIVGSDTVRRYLTYSTAFLSKFAVIPPILIGTNGSDSICYGDSAVLGVTTAANTTFIWSTGATTSSITVKPLSTTTYSVSINNGCEIDTSYIKVTVIPGIKPVISANPDTICAGDSVKLIAGGGVTYKWSTGQTTDSIYVKPTSTTTYTLTASVGKCSHDSVITIVTTSSFTTVVTVSPDTICKGGSAVLSASGGITYKWSNGSTLSSITVAPDSTQVYYLISNSPCGIDTVTKTVHVIPFASPIITGRTSLCSGEGDTITISGGTYTYSWSNGSTGSSYILNTITGDSTISVKVSNGKCYIDTTIKVLVKPPPSFTVSNGGVCSGQCFTLTATDAAKGDTYKWSNGATTDTTTVCPTSTKIYNVTVSDGCVKTATATVTVTSASLVACCDTVIYKGDSAYLSALSSTGKYNWSPSTGLNCDTCQNVKAYPTVTTSYTVTGADTNGCEESTVITVIVEIPCADFVVPNVFTPNSDSRNDQFVINTENLDKYSIVIYDRWGKEMYKSSNPLVYWDGTTESGSKASDGVYFYIISSTCQGKNYDKQGFVQLIR